MKVIFFKLASRVLDSHFVDADGDRKAWLFHWLVQDQPEWMEECLQCKDDAFPQMLLMTEPAAARRSMSIGRSWPRAVVISGCCPFLTRIQPSGSTAAVDFETVKARLLATLKSHVSHVTADSG